MATMPTGAPDNQFRINRINNVRSNEFLDFSKMQDRINNVRNTSLPNFWGWGRGFLFQRWYRPGGTRKHLGSRLIAFSGTVFSRSPWLSIFHNFRNLQNNVWVVLSSHCAYTVIYVLFVWEVVRSCLFLCVLRNITALLCVTVRGWIDGSSTVLGQNHTLRLPHAL